MRRILNKAKPQHPHSHSATQLLFSPWNFSRLVGKALGRKGQEGFISFLLFSFNTVNDTYIRTVAVYLYLPFTFSLSSLRFSFIFTFS
jgi:hypothetical protein